MMAYIELVISTLNALTARNKWSDSPITSFTLRQSSRYSWMGNGEQNLFFTILIGSEVEPVKRDRLH
jgi:hypothetical protein